ncbi:MAG: hypothetical protein GX100_02555 [candidate division WS1 bacterium]|nr:hypothetical protein [candidate division WS1 bacterium]
MCRPWFWAIIPGILAVVAVVLILTLLVIKLLWAWTIPDLFPGAVASGQVAGTISWYTAMKLAIFIAVMAGIARGAGEHRVRHKE